MRFNSLLFLLFWVSSLSVYGQNTGTILGIVTDENNNPVELVNVAILGTAYGTQTNEKGRYEFEAPVGNNQTLVFSFVGYEEYRKQVNVSDNQRLRMNATLKSKSELIPEVQVKSKGIEQSNVVKIDPKQITRMPSASIGVEAIIKTLPGVVSNSELSSQYSVRGGSYDENLVYVNDFEIYRPFLIRSGQQEGLSFINPDMVQSISFSAGGFEAKYGDKMSSVLDVKYRRAREFGGTISLSLLGASAHIEGASKNQLFSYTLGFRNKTNRYLFNSLPTEGEYNPAASDIQTYLSYDLSPNWQVQFIGNYARNRFRYIPESLEESFGTFNETLGIRVFFDGSEKDTYENFMGGLATAYISDDKRLGLKFMASAYSTEEQEAFSIIGAYLIGEVEKNFSNENFGEITRTLGVGAFHNWARNRLYARIFNFAHRGNLDKGSHYFSWGAKIQRELIEDEINEWTRLDSADYSKPVDRNALSLSEVLKTKINLNSNRVTAFVQDNWKLGQNDRLSITAGLRVHWWDVNKEFIMTPRLQMAFRPKSMESAKNRHHDLIFRFSAGLYYQPPFYRELRNQEGVLNLNLRAQKSAHLVLGSDYTFPMWNRPFKFTSELYYKHLWDLVPYDIENVLIRYHGTNTATGYATGIDLRLNGEFVKGAESWISLSIAQTRENLSTDDYYRYFDSEGTEISPYIITDAIVTDSTLVQPGFIPRPTDQRVNMSVFFQDHVPNNENYKVHLNLVFGTGMSFSPQGRPRFRNAFRIPPYRRLDIGFSALLFDENKRELRPRSGLRYFKNIWASLEIFNLLGVSNTISYTWVEDLTGRVWGVPNHLTSRRLNFKLQVKF